jgi:hypothetical protein
MICKQVKDNGEQCQANAMTDSEYCFTHNPETTEQVKEAGKKGGQVSYYDKGLIKAEPIDITADKTAIIYLLADTINRVRRIRQDGSLDIKVANCIGFLSSKMLEAQKELILSDRLDQLENKLIEQGVLK